eukprot:PhM_4_TR15329/c0_g1_i1/m.60848
MPSTLRAREPPQQQPQFDDDGDRSSETNEDETSKRRKVTAAAAAVPTSTCVRVCLTGGPCGGKSTALRCLQDTFRALNFNVFTVPETATIMMGGGLRFGNPDHTTAFQHLLLRTQLYLEDTFLDVARVAGGPSLVISDRGALDGKAYCTPGMWDDVKRAVQRTEEELRDARYDVVVHLVTAARGAEGFYTLENNETRTETPEHARRLDEAVQHAYLGHPSLYVVDNSGSFDEKMRRVVDVIKSVVVDAAPSTLRYTKYLMRRQQTGAVRVPLDDIVGNSTTEHEVVVTLLSGSTPMFETRLYERCTRGHWLAWHQTVHRHEGAPPRIHQRRLQTLEDKDALLRTHPPLTGHTPLRKRIECFLYCDHSFELATIDEAEGPTTQILWVQCPPGSTPRLPEPLRDHVAGDVTCDLSYTTFSLSKVR